MKFWEMTIREAADIIRAKQRADDDKLRSDASLVHSLAMLISQAVWNARSYPRTVSAAFPALFKDKGVDKENWEIIKANMQSFAQANNKKRGD